MEDKTAEALWLDYQFLTKEILKFLVNEDMDLFYNLLNQREQLQAIIDRTPDEGFKVSPAGRNLLTKIHHESQLIINNLQLRLGRNKRQHQVSEAYGAVNTTAVSQMNWTR